MWFTFACYSRTRMAKRKKKKIDLSREFTSGTSGSNAISRSGSNFTVTLREQRAPKSENATSPPAAA
jgi:hypothetical protein